MVENKKCLIYLNFISTKPKFNLKYCKKIIKFIIII